MKNSFLMKLVFTGFIMLTNLFISNAQILLKERLEGKKTLQEIMAQVDEHYKNRHNKWRGYNEALPTIKHWKRWEWWLSNRLGSQGEFVDINRRNLKEYEKLSVSNRNINGSWSRMGPITINEGFGVGRADRIAFHPTDPNTYYVGTSGGGLWKTTDNGFDWDPVSDDISSLGISGVVVSWASPNTIYILTGDGDSDLFGGLVENLGYERKCVGVYKSTNGGTTWALTSPLDSINFLAMQMKMSPTDANVLLVATTAGIYRTANGGGSWTRVREGQFHDIEFKPGTNRAYASGLNEILYSADGGVNWFTSSLDIPVNNVMRMELAVTPAISTIVYLLAGSVPADSAQFGGLYISFNNGVTYQQISNSPNILGQDSSDIYQQARYSHCMAVSNTNASKIVTGAVYSYRSIDGGQSWLASGFLHPDHHMIAYNPLNNNVYSCTDGGLYRSEDDGETWINLTYGFEASQFYHLAGTTAGANYLLGGLQDNGVIKRTANSSTWTELKYIDGFMLAYAPGKKDTMYIGGNEELWRSTDGGVTLDSITPLGPPDKEFFGNVLTHINSDSVLFAGFSSVFKSLDRGNTWTDMSARGNWAMTNCPSNSNRIYCAGATSFTPNENGQLFRSDDLGITWFELTNNDSLPEFTNSTKITDIAVRPSNSNHVFVTMAGFTEGQKVYRSTNAGTAWTNWSGSLPNVPVNAIAIDQYDGVYIGTDIGVFYRTTSMGDWVPFRNGLPNVPVTDFVIDQATNKIRCSTFGRGAWQSNLAQGCVLSMSIGLPQDGYKYFQVTENITASSRVIGAETTSIHYKAGQFIVMSPGFRAEKNATFSARIGPCGTGGIPDFNEGEEVEEKK